jgi:hypothetical protein
VRAARLAVAAAENPDVREVKRCRWATSSERFAPCELPMGHEGNCYNGEQDLKIRAAAERLCRDFRCFRGE